MRFFLRHPIPVSLVLIAARQMTSIAQASGTYPPAPPRLRSEVIRDIDPEAYNLGKAIFVGRANLNAMAAAGSQEAANNRRELAAIVARIPERAREQLDIAALSRALDSSSTNALIYYLKLRFRLTEDSE